LRRREATARRYAKALFAAARESGTTEAVLREVDAVLAVAAADPALRDVLARPWIKPEDRRAIAAAVAARLGCGPMVGTFVGLVARRGRMVELAEIVAAYRALVDEDLGQARAQVRAAVPLTDHEKQRIAARLEQALGKRIILEERRDERLLGGFVAQVGSLVFDASLSGQLRRLRARLVGG
jgi:F-type H+-transporting ATPase subunit delta